MTKAAAHETGSSVDVNASTETVDINAVNRSDGASGDVITMHVEFSGAGEVEVRFYDSDARDGAFTSRDKNDLSDYSVSGAGEVFVTTDLASPFVRVRISDNSGAANDVDYNIYIK